MALAPLAAISFFVEPVREFTTFEFDDPSLKLGICILEFVGSSVELLLELLVPMSKLVDRVLHVEETVVISSISHTGCWRCINNTTSSYESSISVATFGKLASSSMSSHGS